MFYRILTVFLSIQSSFAFISSKRNSNTNVIVHKSQPKPMYTDTNEFMNISSSTGAIEPLGFWDPLRLTQNMDESLFKYMREAEVHHSRIAMLSMLVLPVLDKTFPNQFAIDVYQNSPELFPFSMMIIYEFCRISVMYKNPSDKLFRLKDNVYPGNVFNNSLIDRDQVNKELSNGRLAMVGSFLYICQELFLNQKVF